MHFVTFSQTWKRKYILGVEVKGENPPHQINIILGFFIMHDRNC